MPIQFAKFTVGPLEENSYLLHAAASREAWVVDPGAEAERFLDYLAANSLRLTRILHTHAHGDHIGADSALVEATGARIAVHRLETEWLSSPALNLSLAVGLPVVAPAADEFLEDGQELSLGETILRVLHTPGHSPGSVSFYTPGHLFSGDLLFWGSIGRTDLPGGDMAMLERSLREKIYRLPDDTAVHSGHGPDTTLGHEKRTNPFVRALPA